MYEAIEKYINSNKEVEAQPEIQFLYENQDPKYINYKCINALHCRDFFKPTLQNLNGITGNRSSSKI